MQVKIINICISICFFVFSMFLYSYYKFGDLYWYSEIYKNMPDQLISAFQFYSSSIDSKEIIHFLIVYVFHNILNKDVLFSFINAVMIYNILLYLQKINVSWFIIILILFNYYTIVLLTSAERLKVAMLFFMFALNAKNSRNQYINVLLSLVSHLQMSMLYIVILVRNMLYKVSNRITLNKILKTVSIVIIIALVGFFFLKDQFLNKLVWIKSYGVSETYKSIICLILSIVISKKILDPILLISPFIIACLYIGGTRINMFSFLIFCYFAFQNKRGMNTITILSLLFFLYKTIYFIMNVIKYGDGFL